MQPPLPGQPPGQPSLFDTGNILLTAGEPAQLSAGKIPVPGGEAGVATIRTKTTTLTISMDKAQACDWRDVFSALADSLSGTGLIIPGKAQAGAIASAATARGQNGQK